MASALAGLDLSSMNLLSLFTPTGDYPGTGIITVVQQSEQALGKLPDSILNMVIAELPALFGDYPNSTDTAPSGVFLAVFAILALAHFYIFIRNKMAGQNVWISLGLALYCILRVIGFALRINWAQDVLRVKVGIAATVFCQVPVLYLNIMNMLFSHRIFTWRHPETGSSPWFNGLMSLIYLVVLGVIVMAIVGQALPYIYFLTPHHFHMCEQVTQASGVLELLYALAGIQLIAIAYTFPVGSIDHRLFRMPRKYRKEHLPHTYQPSWIESTGLFYFPPKGSQQVVYKDDPEGLDKAIRVIATNQQPASGVVNPRNPVIPNGPRITTDILIIIATSLLLTLECSFRVAAVFTGGARGGGPGESINHFVFHNYVFYVFYGAIEAIVNVIYLVFRCDLRFYIPDMAKKAPKGFVHQARDNDGAESQQKIINEESFHDANSEGNAPVINEKVEHEHAIGPEHSQV